jgi:hypothetical protein
LIRNERPEASAKPRAALRCKRELVRLLFLAGFPLGRCSSPRPCGPTAANARFQAGVIRQQCTSTESLKVRTQFGFWLLLGLARIVAHLLFSLASSLSRLRVICRSPLCGDRSLDRFPLHAFLAPLSASLKVDFSDVLEVTLPAAVAPQEFSPNTADFVENCVVHSQFLRIVCPSRTCGTVSGETNKGDVIRKSAHIFSSFA